MLSTEKRRFTKVIYVSTIYTVVGYPKTSECEAKKQKNLATGHANIFIYEFFKRTGEAGLLNIYGFIDQIVQLHIYGKHF